MLHSSSEEYNGHNRTQDTASFRRREFLFYGKGFDIVQSPHFIAIDTIVSHRLFKNIGALMSKIVYKQLP